ncbi:MAG: hypothetical protein RLY86_3479 [Pseudomonadota bacterium]|jgi:chaperone required for assembly of F1-ATPase
MKRFYKTATAAPVDSADDSAGGFQVLLDGKPVRTPSKALLLVPTMALAEAIAAEWQGQGESVVPQSMPLTQYAATTIDGVIGRRDGVVDAVCAYAGTDLLCYRADHPLELAERQAMMWQPLLDWAAVRHGAVLVCTSGIVHRPQDPAALAALGAAVAGLDDWRLCGLQGAVGAAGSLVIGLALLEGRLSAEEAFAISQLDETFQIEQWGEDAEAMKRRDALRADLAATERFLRICAA